MSPYITQYPIPYTNGRYMRLYFLIPILAICLLFNQTVNASEIDRDLTFKRIAILGLEDSTKEYGSLINNFIKNNFMDAMQFEIVMPDEAIKYPVSKKDAVKLGRKMNADAIVTGTVKVEENILKIYVQMINAKTGNLFSTESKWIKDAQKEGNIQKNVKELTAKLISRIPYRALITEVSENEVVINAGKIHGMEDGAKLSAFEIKGIKSHPFTGEIISFEKEAIAELTVIKVEDIFTRARIKEIKKGKNVEINNKIDFKPSLKVIADNAAKRKDLLARKEKEALEMKAKKEPEKEKRKSNIVGLEAFAGLTTNDYSFDSNELKFSRKANSFFAIGFKGELWPVSYLGIDLSYKTGWLKFNKIGTASISTSASPYWLAANVKYRYNFTDKPTSPQIIGKVGYHIYDFSVDKSDSLYFNSYSYKGINIGLGAKIPFWESFGINLNGDYLPMLSVKEDPVTSGSKGKASGYLLGFGLYYVLTEGFIADVNYSYNSYKADFTGTGTRAGGTTSASSTDTYNGMNLNIRYEF